MLKELIPFLIIGIAFSATSNAVAIAPVSNTLEKPLATTDFFSIKITPNGDPVTLQATHINEKLKLGTAVLANCEADGTNWKCKPSEALEADSHVLALASVGAQIKELTTTVTEDTKTVIIPAITARPKTATVKGEIAAETDIEITLTANAAPGAAIAGSALSNYFKLGSVNLGTCSGTGFASDAVVAATTDIKCKTGSKLEVSNTPYTLTLQSGKTAVSSKTIAAFGDVTVSSAANSGGDGDGDGKSSSKFLSISFVFFIFALLF
jgi:hypothetical protein